jgi:carboxymethylenebutenolidase
MKAISMKAMKYFLARSNLQAVVPFYGRQARPEDVPRIQAPLLLQYAELDTRINEGWPAYEAGLKEHGKTYEAYIYPGVNHGFHNDSTPQYDKDAAELAWSRTIEVQRELGQRSWSSGHRQPPR